jgi:OOP family OmpA-OmpF porin
MKLNTEYDVTIIGHTDSRGSAAFNKTLSTKRAESVKSDLVSRGVEASRIQTLGNGEEQPIADNATAEGRAKNRRIEAQLRLQ